MILRHIKVALKHFIWHMKFICIVQLVIAPLQWSVLLLWVLPTRKSEREARTFCEGCEFMKFNIARKPLLFYLWIHLMPYWCTLPVYATFGNNCYFQSWMCLVHQRTAFISALPSSAHCLHQQFFGLSVFRMLQRQ